MYTRVEVIILFVVAIVGCSTSTLQPSSPLRQGATEGVLAAPELGIATDLNLTVTAIQPGSAVENFDIQIGDTLVDLQWLRSAMPEASQDAEDGIVIDAEGNPTYNGVVITEPVPIPPATIPPEEYVEMEAIPFTELALIVTLVSYGFPLQLRLLRDSKEVTIQVTPGPRMQPLMKLPERNDPDNHAYYYF